MSSRNDEERSLDKYFDSIRSLPLLTVEEEQRYGHMWQDERNPEALKMLVEGNLRFVVKECRKFEGMGLDLLDLISEGNLGLIEGAKRFDPTRGNKFLTYASWWIRQAIFHALSEHGHRIRIPTKVASRLLQLNRLTNLLFQELGRHPTVLELSQNGKFTVAEIERLQAVQRSTKVVSIDQMVGDTELTLGDSLEQTLEPSALNTMDNDSFLEQMEAFLSHLPKKEHQILIQHFGLGGTEPMTLEQIGRSLDPPVSRERVRQIEERAFARMRKRDREVLEGFLGAGVS